MTFPKITLITILFSLTTAVLAQQPSARREFRPGTVRQIADLPAGRLRTQIERLPGPARDRAVAWLGSFHFTDLDLETLQVDSAGGIYYADPHILEGAGTPEQLEPPVAEAAIPSSPFPATLVFHSRPGAPNVLFLNFSGEDVSGTAWNTSLSRSVIRALPFSTDADFSTFSDGEQLAIKRIWQRVVEDYAPFNIDVTTERPATFGNRTANALITRNIDADDLPNPSSSSGGVAYVGVFGGSSFSKYRPAWIYSNNLAGDESFIAEAVSHEVGHNLGLSHDGETSGSEYYGGHGTGNTSWGPLMGTGYNRNVSQWSKGEYYQANNTQDDLATIAGKLAYRTDDHGNSKATASALIITGGTNITSTTPENDPENANTANKGVLGSNTDVDVFSFATGTGPIRLTVRPWISPTGRTRGGNLDILLELYDASGTMIVANNAATETFAEIQTSLTEGVYELRVSNSGTGSPLNSPPTGYTAYGSVGQYFVSGYLVPSGLIIPPGAELTAADIALPGQGPGQFTVTYSDNVAVAAATIDDEDVLISGPNGYSRPGRLIGRSTSANTTPIVATYEIEPPNGTVWTEMDNGSYTVTLRTSQVGDTEGEWVPAGPLGQFKVAIPRLIYFAGMNTNPGWTLQPLWQYGAPGYSIGGPNGGFTGSAIIGYNLGGNYENHLSPVYATTPAIDCSSVASVTLRFRRWLKLKRGDTATIQVSTNGSEWAAVWTTTQPVSDNSWQEVQYALPSFAACSPSVRVRWGMASGPAQNEIGWNIDDMELFGDGQLDTTSPLASLNIANLTTEGSPGHEFSVTYSDDVALDTTTLGNGDLLVTGPNGYSNLVEFVGVDVPNNGTPRTATYSVSAPFGAWAATDNGVYQVTLLSAGVADVSGNFIDETALGQFTVAISTVRQMLIVRPTVLEVPEGGTASVTVALAEQPSSNVIVTTVPMGEDPDLVVESGATNLFTPLNWSRPVSVVFRALTDTDQQNGSAAFEFRSEGLTAVSTLVTEQDTTPDNVLVVSSSNPEWGTVNPAGGSFPVGTAVQVTGTPSDYFEFEKWTGDLTGTNNPMTVTMNSNITLQAMFREQVTTLHGTPHWWLASVGYESDFDAAESMTGANGIPLWQSYVAGLDPADPESQLRVTLLRGPDFNTWILLWNPVTNRFYTVLQSTNLDQGFTALPEGSELPSTVQSYTNSTPDSPPSIFYRLEVKKP